MEDLSPSVSASPLFKYNQSKQKFKMKKDTIGRTAYLVSWEPWGRLPLVFLLTEYERACLGRIFSDLHGRWPLGSSVSHSDSWLCPYNNTLQVCTLHDLPKCLFYTSCLNSGERTFKDRH